MGKAKARLKRYTVQNTERGSVPWTLVTSQRLIRDIKHICSDTATQSKTVRTIERAETIAKNHCSTNSNDIGDAECSIKMKNNAESRETTGRTYPAAPVMMAFLPSSRPLPTLPMMVVF